MADPIETGETDEWLRQELGSLSQADVADPDTEVSLVDGFISMHNKLPKASFSDVADGDMLVRFADGEWSLRPVAQQGGRLVVRDLVSPIGEGRRPRLGQYRLLIGSFYSPDIEQEQSEDGVNEVIPLLVNNQAPHVGIVNLGENEKPLRVAYLPLMFCRGALLLYLQMYTPADLRSPAFRRRSDHHGVTGSMLTIQAPLNHPVTLFVDTELKTTDSVNNVERRLGEDYRTLLSFVDPEA